MGVNASNAERCIAVATIDPRQGCFRPQNSRVQPWGAATPLPPPSKTLQDAENCLRLFWVPSFPSFSELQQLGITLVHPLYQLNSKPKSGFPRFQTAKPHPASTPCGLRKGVFALKTPANGARVRLPHSPAPSKRSKTLKSPPWFFAPSLPTACGSPLPEPQTKKSPGVTPEALSSTNKFPASCRGTSLASPRARARPLIITIENIT